MKRQMNDEVILSVKDLKTYIKIDKQMIKAVNGVSFDVKKGTTLGLVGESGCGKSVTAHSVMQLLPRVADIIDGSVSYTNSSGEPLQLSDFKKNGKEMRAIRGSEISMVFQDPMMSLNPVHRVGSQIVETLRQHERISKKAAMQRAVDMLSILGIPEPEKRINDYPHQFSGGMKQRVIIAIALICNPTLLIADEPTTALDVTIQAQILELMKSAQQKYGTSILLITHNMGIVADMADEIAVMYMGKIVEFGSVQQVFEEAEHPYTKALLKSVPVLGMGDERGELEVIRGSTPVPSNMPMGCEFNPRCDFVMERCTAEAPPDFDLGNGHKTRCWLCKEGCSNG